MMSSVSFYAQKESGHLDRSISDIFEEVLPSIQSIIDRFSSVLSSKRVMVRAERAKHTDAETLLHLSAHSEKLRYVQGNRIVPSEVLSKEFYDDIHSYENRFLMTLLKRALVFLNDRIEYIQANLPLFHALQASFAFGDQRLQILWKRPVDSLQLEKDLERLKKLRSTVVALGQKPLMKALLGSPEIVLPLAPTNLLRLDPDYKKAVELWDYIHAYRSMGVLYDAERGENLLSPEDMDEFRSILQIFERKLRTFERTSSSSAHELFQPMSTFSLEHETLDGGRFFYASFRSFLKQEEMQKQVSIETDLAERGAKSIDSYQRRRTAAFREVYAGPAMESQQCNDCIKALRREKKGGRKNETR
ncbi:MAG: DUF2357 domain-containing protein [Bacilli bacterium]|nr:DUF2357 domain-containing protein [Bacilli bacterium]